MSSLSNLFSYDLTRVLILGHCECRLDFLHISDLNNGVMYN